MAAAAEVLLVCMDNTVGLQGKNCEVARVMSVQQQQPLHMASLCTRQWVLILKLHSMRHGGNILRSVL